jgi:SAM-dependent methyltransferase
MTTSTDQQTIDERNSAFWDELCGTHFAQSLGITDRSPESLRRFDSAYMDLYPYLSAQLPPATGSSASVLEIGLGYGTVSQRLAEAGFSYHGLDIADGPVEMVRGRLRLLGIDHADDRVVRGSALEIPHPDETFDHVVTIGCLHHTGNLPLAVREVHRVLRPGGTAMVMLYNRHSWRQLVMRWQALRRRWDGTKVDEDEAARAAYDADSAGGAAPETVFVTARQVRDELFAGFGDVRIERHNFDPTYLGTWLGKPVWVTREQALPTVARVMGLDLYIQATK